MGRNRISEDVIARINKLNGLGVKPLEIAKECGVSIASVYKYLTIPKASSRLDAQNEKYAPLLEAYYAGNKLKTFLNASTVSVPAFYAYLQRNELPTRREVELTPTPQTKEEQTDFSKVVTG